MFNIIWAIAKNTFLEGVRDRVFFVLILFFIVMLVVSIFLGSISVHQDSKIIADFGIAAAELFSLAITVFVGASLLSKEIEKRTIIVLLSKPITSTQFITGKFIGLAAMMLVILLVMLVIYILMSLLYHFWSPTIFLIFFLIYLQMLIIIGITLLFSSFTSPMLVVMLTIITYMIGHLVADLHEFARIIHNPVVTFFTQITSYILPNLDMLNLKNTVFYNDLPVTPSYIFYAVLYTLVYTGIILGVTILNFKKREF